MTVPIEKAVDSISTQETERKSLFKTSFSSIPTQFHIYDLYIYICMYVFYTKNDSNYKLFLCEFLSNT